MNASNVLDLGGRTGWPPADTGPALGLSGDWARRAVAEVGNHGELFERHLGQGSARKLGRGPNRLWRDGGLMLAPPVR